MHSGGFGVVVKAKNRIDGVQYAVKKMRASATDKRVQREVVVSGLLLCLHFFIFPLSSSVLFSFSLPFSFSLSTCLH